MTDDEDLFGESLDDLKDDIAKRGIFVAYRALLSVCKNEKAPPPSRATAATAIFRAGGLLNSAETKPDDGLATLSDEDLQKLKCEFRAQVDASERAQASGGGAKHSGAPKQSRKDEARGLFD